MFVVKVVVVIFSSIFVQSATATITDSDFLELKDKVTEIYNLILQSQKGVDLQVNLDEDNRDYVGGTSLTRTALAISIGADFHKTSEITKDAYLAILCHEIGHLLGGEPRVSKNIPSAFWQSETGPSVEGQSDYYSTTCMQKIFALTESTVDVYPKVSQRIKDLCSQKFTISKDKNICMHTALAGFELMDYLYSVFAKYGPNDYMKKPNMDAVEKAGVSQTALYPTLQCRFDTILAGALGNERPNCWYPLIEN